MENQGCEKMFSIENCASTNIDGDAAPLYQGYDSGVSNENSSTMIYDPTTETIHTISGGGSLMSSANIQSAQVVSNDAHPVYR